MEYTDEIFDRKTGEVVSVSMGDWITISELGDLFSTGPRKARSVLRHLGFLQVEGGGKSSRHRLANWVTERGWGKRIKPKTGKFPFDTVGPDATAWIKARWDKAFEEVERTRNSGPIVDAKAALTAFNATRISEPLNVEGEVRWLSDYFPHLTHEQIGACLEVSRQLVDRYIERRDKQVQELRGLRGRPLGDLAKQAVASMPGPITEEGNTSKNDHHQATPDTIAQAA